MKESKERKLWREEYEAGKKREAEFATQSSVDVAPLYTPSDIAGADYLESLGFPGQYPYTRGIYPTMYRGNRATPAGLPPNLRRLLDWRMRLAAAAQRLREQGTPFQGGGTHEARPARKTLRLKTFSLTRGPATTLQLRPIQPGSRKTEARRLPAYPSVDNLRSF